MKTDPKKSAINRGYLFCEKQQRLLDSGAITEADWFENHSREFAAAYLAQKNPRAQSGHSGDEERYRYTQEMILQTIHRSGTFLDVGCANGHLLEMLDRWLAGSGHVIEFHGLDISPGLIDLARSRLPQWAERFYLGNALYWTPPRPFDFTCVRELDYVPRARQREFMDRLYQEYATPGGRLIIGPFTEDRARPGIEKELASWGYRPAGRAAKPHQDRPELERRLLWFDRPGGK